MCGVLKGIMANKVHDYLLMLELHAWFIFIYMLCSERCFDETVLNCTEFVQTESLAALIFMSQKNIAYMITELQLRLFKFKLL